MHDRLFSRRMVSDRAKHSSRLTRPLYRLLYRLADRMVGSGDELHFEGGAHWFLSQDGEWGEQSGEVSDPRPARSPLFIFGPLASTDDMSPLPEHDVVIRGSATRCYQSVLHSNQFQGSENAPAILEDAERRGLSTSSIQVLTWIDDAGRICRVSYEASYHEQSETVMWTGTEFWDFGVPIDRHPPLKKQLAPNS